MRMPKEDVATLTGTRRCGGGSRKGAGSLIEGCGKVEGKESKGKGKINEVYGTLGKRSKEIELETQEQDGVGVLRRMRRQMPLT
jgi:hypothetical protein